MSVAIVRSAGDDEPARGRGKVAAASRLKVLRTLATGGMGEVLEARRTLAQGSEQLVVIKRILPRHALDPAYRKMFEEEIRIAAAIQHPNAVQVLDVIAVHGSLMLVMEHLDGITLGQFMSSHLRRGIPIPLGVVVTILTQLCEALHATHTRGRQDSGTPWIHRDVSPGNVILTSDGYVKLIDFGVAKDLARTGDTQVGQIKGKFGYHAPEQLLLRPLDERVDVYAAGVVLHEMLSLARLFPPSLPAAEMLPARRCPPRSVRTARPDLPAELDAVIARALAFDPDDRFGGARMLAAEAQAVPGAHLVPPTLLAEAVHQARWPDDTGEVDTEVKDWTHGVDPDGDTADDDAPTRHRLALPRRAFEVVRAPSVLEDDDLAPPPVAADAPPAACDDTMIETDEDAPPAVAAPPAPVASPAPPPAPPRSTAPLAGLPAPPDPLDTTPVQLVSSRPLVVALIAIAVVVAAILAWPLVFAGI